MNGITSSATSIPLITLAVLGNGLCHDKHCGKRKDKYGDSFLHHELLGEVWIQLLECASSISVLGVPGASTKFL